MNKDEKKLVNNIEIANIISSQHKLIYCAGDFYEYQEGYYRKIDIKIIHKWIKDYLGYDFNSKKATEITNNLSVDSYIGVKELNNTALLNVRNGLYNIQENKLYSHTDEVHSSIQLQVKFNPATNCKKWKKTLDEIFKGDVEKIRIIQEYFGYCLTKITKFEKALFCVGEGENGKSTVLYVLEHLVGKENVSAIPLEKFNNTHYLAELYGKQVNMSIETQTKSTIYDSKFKAIVTGDLITADRKFKPPFEFHPFCKLVFAVNTMPRVENKTVAYYRRLIIIRFERRFKEHESNKNLKYELVGEELDGIFIWALEGLRRLLTRGLFKLSDSMKEAIEQYQKENNNTIVFVDENCVLGAEHEISIDKLYSNYKEWCKEAGLRPFGKINFGKELLKQYPSIEKGRDTKVRFWKGIDTLPMSSC